LNEATAVVVLFAGALGDFLLALPALRLLRRRHAGAPLALAVRAPLVALAARAAAADRVAALDDPAMAVLLGGGEPPGWWPRGARLYSWFGADDPAIRGRLAGLVVGADFLRVERGEDGAHAAVAYAAAVGESRPWKDLVSLGRFPGAASEAPGRLIVHRGAGGPAKRWTADGFAAVTAWWREQGGRVIDLLGPAEERTEPLPGAEPWRDRPLTEVADLLVQGGSYVGNDSGPTHLAAALGLGGAVLFGPTDPARWRPLSASLAVFRASPHACRPLGFDDPPPRAVVACLARGPLP
jgi:ADP-heptose:LPS heptosyltransferase